MAGDRVVWKRRRPNRAAGRLAWTCFVGLGIAGPAWLLFGGEPKQADDGALNPLALVAPVTLAFLGLALVVQVVALVRRPVVSADHYALTVRAGVGRTLVLPWAGLAELAAVDLDEEQILLVRCRPQPRGSGDRPRWWDQGTLRSVVRGAAFASAYDLAVPMADFVGSAEYLLADLGECAPDHVALIRRGAPPRRPAGERSAVPRPAIERSAMERSAIERSAMERSAIERSDVERSAIERSGVEGPAIERSERSAIDWSGVERSDGA